MASYTPLQPVSEAVYALLQDATLTALLAATGVTDDVPEDPVFPFLWFEVIETQQFGGFGTKAGDSALPEIEIRLHAFGDTSGWAPLQVIIARAIALLSTTDALSVTGYRVCGAEPFHDETIPLPDQELNGVKVKELVSKHRLYVEEL